jgi:hypothetical protein
MTEVEVWDGVALSLDIEPSLGRATISRLSGDFGKRLELARRNVTASFQSDKPLRATAIIPGDGTDVPVLLAQFASWAARTFDPIPQELRALAGPSARPKSDTSVELSTRERETLLQLVIGMAVGGYGYDPDRGRNEATQQIVDDLAQRGISLDADTVRKWLKEGAKLLPTVPAKPNSG